MRRDLGKAAFVAPLRHRAGLPPRAPGQHALLDEGAITAHDCVCHVGARSPAGTGEYSRVCVSVIVGGAFHARSSEGAALAAPGALLLGNSASGYTFRHVDDGGDRSLVFRYADAVVDEVSSALGLRARAARPFARACLPASSATAEAAVRAQVALGAGDAEALREAALFALGSALAVDRGVSAAAEVQRSPAQVRRVTQVLRFIETHSSEDCSNATLCARAQLSSFHFLRLFHALTGQTPRQFVIHTRLRRAAVALRTTRDPITRIAMDVGFGDLSHFVGSFTRTFGDSPRGYRKRS